VSDNFRVDYLRPAMTSRLIATVRRAGRTVAIVDIDVADSEGRLVAVGAAATPTSRDERPRPTGHHRPLKMPACGTKLGSQVP
jgi:hypothetical protein